MSRLPDSAAPPLGRTDILLRASIAAFLAFALVRVVIEGVVAAGLHWPAEWRWWLWAARMPAIAVVYALTCAAFWPRLGVPAAVPSRPVQFVVVAGIGLVAWAACSSALMLITVTTGWWLPGDFAWSIGALAVLALWRRSRVLASARPPRAAPVLWRVPFAVAFAAMYAAPWLLLDRVMSGAFPWVSHLAVPCAVLMAYVVFNAAVRGEPVGRRKRGQSGALLLVEAGALLFALFAD